MSERLALAGRIRAALEEVKTTVNRTVMLAEKARRSGDDDYWDAVALNLHGFYSGVEQIFEDIARTIDGGLLSGAEWHTSLLRQMTVEMGKLRPTGGEDETVDEATVRSRYVVGLLAPKGFMKKFKSADEKMGLL